MFLGVLGINPEGEVDGRITDDDLNARFHYLRVSYFQWTICYYKLTNVAGGMGASSENLKGGIS